MLRRVENAPLETFLCGREPHELGVSGEWSPVPWTRRARETRDSVHAACVWPTDEVCPGVGGRSVRVGPGGRKGSYTGPEVDPGRGTGTLGSDERGSVRRVVGVGPSSLSSRWSSVPDRSVWVPRRQVVLFRRLGERRSDNGVDPLFDGPTTSVVGVRFGDRTGTPSSTGLLVPLRPNVSPEGSETRDTGPCKSRVDVKFFSNVQKDIRSGYVP